MGFVCSLFIMSSEEPMQVTSESQVPITDASPPQVDPAAPAPAPDAPNPESDQPAKLVSDEKTNGNVPNGGAKNDLQSLPTRQYLNQSVVPILLQALTALSKERPPDAIDFLIAYLMKNKSTLQQQQQQSS